MEAAAWPAVKGKVLLEATEIFLRLLKGEKLSREDVTQQQLSASDFRSPEDWNRGESLSPHSGDRIPLEPFWNFEKIGVIPFDAPLELLRLTVGSHDPAVQKLANSILPVGVFNLSITPPAVIEETHLRMAKEYHESGG